MASELVEARLLWAILSLVLPVTFGHATACRSPAPAFSAVMYFAMKRSAPSSAVLRHSPSSWAAVNPLVGVDIESSEIVQQTPHPLFFLAPRAARAPHQFSEHHARRHIIGRLQKNSTLEYNITALLSSICTTYIKKSNGEEFIYLFWDPGIHTGPSS